MSSTSRGMAKGLGPPGSKLRESVLKEPERVKWCLWNGNAFETIDTVSWLPADIFVEDPTDKHKKLTQNLEEFETDIRNNARLISIYAERYRYGETISTAFADSTINQRDEFKKWYPSFDQADEELSMAA